MPRIRNRSLGRVHEIVNLQVIFRLAAEPLSGRDRVNPRLGHYPMVTLTPLRPDGFTIGSTLMVVSLPTVRPSFTSSFFSGLRFGAALVTTTFRGRESM